MTRIWLQDRVDFGVAVSWLSGYYLVFTHAPSPPPGLELPEDMLYWGE